jgi:hypothetical protein
MDEYKSGNMLKGLQWKLIGLSVAGISVLQVIAYFAMKFLLIQSLSLTVLLVSYIIIPRVKERKFAHAVVGVIGVWIIGVLLEVGLEKYWTVVGQLPFIEMCVYPLLLGIVVSYGYMRLTNWSNRKRSEIDARKRVVNAPTSIPLQRVHSKKKRKK